MADFSTARWRKSTRSNGNDGNCVELHCDGAVRDSKNVTGGVLRADLAHLIGAVRRGLVR